MNEPVYWPIARLTAAYACGELDPVDVTKRTLARVAEFNPALNAVVCALDDLAMEQAEAARRSYRRGEAGPLSGVPVSIKDTFDIAGYVATRGSLVHRKSVSQNDSGCVRRLREAGAVFIGKTNTAEFGQSATTENRLGDAARNPWDPRRTPGGSSGGAAASVAAGFATVALGADGGGSIRIPAAFTGLVGVKPTYGLCKDEGGFRGMSDFVCPGSLAWRIADARAMLGVLADASFLRRAVGRSLRIAWCPNVEDRPVEGGLIEAAAGAAHSLAALGHGVDEVRLNFEGWNEVFGPLVLDEERRERGHLLTQARNLLTEYELRTLEAAAALTDAAVATARERHAKYQAHVGTLFERYDVILTPTTAVPAFPIDERPKEIAGRKVDALWGAFPFTPAFNVAGTPAVSLPCGFVRGLPVGVQLVVAHGRDDLLLNLSEDLEEALSVDNSAVVARWAQPSRASETRP